MAARALLHKNKLGGFESWLKRQDYIILNTSQNPYEVLRARKDKDTVVVYCKDAAKEHLSVMSKDCALIRRFIKQNKNRMEVTR